MENSILKTIKKYETAEAAINDIATAKQPKDLFGVAYVLTVNKHTYETVKAQIDAKIKQLKDELKVYENKNETVEKLIKEKFLEVYATQQIVVPKKVFNPETNKYEISADSETGEVLMKEKQINNKGDGVFIYKPETKKLVKDLSKITYETHPHLFKQEWVLDKDLVGFADDLPMQEVITPQSVGIQFSNIKAKYEKELALLKEKNDNNYKQSKN